MFTDVSEKFFRLIDKRVNFFFCKKCWYWCATLCGTKSKKDAIWIFKALKITNFVPFVPSLHIFFLGCNRLLFSTENSETEFGVYEARKLVLRRCKKNVLEPKPDSRPCESFLFTVVIRPTQSLICSTVSRTSACCYPPPLPPTSFTNFTWPLVISNLSTSNREEVVLTSTVFKNSPICFVFSNRTWLHLRNQSASFIYLFMHLNYILFNYKCLSTSLSDGVRISTKFESIWKKVGFNLIGDTVV